MQLILGSSSPRRKEILNYFSLPFIQANHPFDERQVTFHGDPEKYVQEISVGKALSLEAQFPHDPIITADTVVYQDGKLFHKPKNLEEAVESLSQLAGRWHTVWTAVTLLYKTQLYNLAEKTEVRLAHLTTLQMHRYIEKVHAFDKAGGYAIQGMGQLIIERIEGCYSGAMGLPVSTLAKLLNKIGIDLWNYLK